MDSGKFSGTGGEVRAVGDYILGRKIGTGAFSTVWKAKHRFLGTEVAVKEIVLDRLSNKLKDNLMSEVSILRRIRHDNIIGLHDFVPASGRIYLVLEYCSGGDLSVYIKNHGRVPERTAKHFLRQLATGLQLLRENNVIHRDLKPQNLLLSTCDDNAVLKIADFGFARSLQPYGLAETLCGSPLYMAPEVMQSQKYDGKADLWSVGVILYQLVTGKTPFSGNSQTQLLRNIFKANSVKFPSDLNLSHECFDLCQKLLRQKAVERMAFEEFFNHQFLSEQPEAAIPSRLISNSRNGLSFVGPVEGRPSTTSSNEDCLPFPLDDEYTAQDADQSFPVSRSSVRSRHPDENTKNMGFTDNLRPAHAYAKDAGVVDSLELIDQEYILVPGPPLDISSSSVSASRPCNSRRQSECSKLASPHFCTLSAPMPIIGAQVNINITHAIGSLESRSSLASSISHGSIELGGVVEQPSSNLMTRIRSLQRVAAVLTELVKDKVAYGQQLEAFSIQLVVLATWKQALHICQAKYASGIDGYTDIEVRTRSTFDSASTGDSTSFTDSELSDFIYSDVEKEFLLGVGHAEELSKSINHMETAVMPDAIDIIFQSALLLGRHGAVAEMTCNTEQASTCYTNALWLLDFLLIEAPSLALNPPLSLTNSDRRRLRMYIDVISKQAQSIMFSNIEHQGLSSSS